MVAFKSALVTTLLLAAKVFAAPLPAEGTWSLNLWCDFEVVSEAEGPPKLGTKYTTRASGSVTEAEAGRISREIGMWSGSQYTATMAADKKIVTVKSKKRTKGQCNDELPKMKSAVTNGLKTKDPLERKPVPAPAPPSRPPPPPPPSRPQPQPPPPPSRPPPPPPPSRPPPPPPPNSGTKPAGKSGPKGGK